MATTTTTTTTTQEAPSRRRQSDLSARWEVFEQDDGSSSSSSLRVRNSQSSTATATSSRDSGNLQLKLLRGAVERMQSRTSWIDGIGSFIAGDNTEYEQEDLNGLARQALLHQKSTPRSSRVGGEGEESQDTRSDSS